MICTPILKSDFFINETAREDFQFPQYLKQNFLLQRVIENLVDGILILTEQGECLYRNKHALLICQQLNPNGEHIRSVPIKIWQPIYQASIESDGALDHTFVIEFEVSNKDLAAFRVRVHWLKLEQLQQRCILVTLEDLNQSIQDVTLLEVRKYGLTTREAEVWLLHKGNSSYKEIAAQLFISLHTVKKHMKNIHAKRRAILDES